MTPDKTAGSACVRGLSGRSLSVRMNAEGGEITAYACICDPKRSLLLDIEIGTEDLLAVSDAFRRLYEEAVKQRTLAPKRKEAVKQQ